ncbi:MAG: PaaI family thioesterase [Chthonomonadales bacterium]|nr:PaaI family thioesterase [Chthonomonadales bacterium]
MSHPKLPNSHRCFVCGDDNPHGLRRRFHTDGERVWTRFTPDVPHMGFAGIAHGGVLAALLDETMGWAPAMAAGRFCMAIELNLEYRRAVPIGTEVTVVGWSTEHRRRIWQAEGEIRDADGTVYVRGHGRFMPMSVERTRQVLDTLVFDEDCVARERLDGSAAPTDGGPA